MPTRTAKADWQGDFKRGGGSVSTETGVLDAPYNFSGRFESGTGTNPEELLAASHASCFTMALSVGLTQAGTPPESLATEAHVTVAQVEGGFGITKIALSVTGKVPGLDAAGFEEAAKGAKAGCPLSKALAAVPEITLGDEVRGLAEVRVDDAGAVVSGRARARDRLQRALHRPVALLRPRASGRGRTRRGSGDRNRPARRPSGSGADGALAGRQRLRIAREARVAAGGDLEDARRR